MADDIFDLPPAKKGAVQIIPPRQQVEKSPRLNEKQMDQLLDGTFQMVSGALSLAKDWMEIERIRETADADVARIDAETRRIVEQIKAEAEMIAKQGDATLKRGQAAAAVIDAILKNIPESDTTARARIIDMLPSLIADATNNNSTGST
jgi:hypothetical protein